MKIDLERSFRGNSDVNPCSPLLLGKSFSRGILTGYRSSAADFTFSTHNHSKFAHSANKRFPAEQGPPKLQ